MPKFKVIIANLFFLAIVMGNKHFLVRDILKEMDPSALLTLNMDEDDVQTEGDKRQKKLKDALDKNASKKKFAGLVRKSTATNNSGKKGMSFKQYQENLKKVEEQKKAEAERRKQAENNIMSTFAAYGSSSSDEDGETDNNEAVENKTSSVDEQSIETDENPDEFKVPQIPIQIEQDESPPKSPTKTDSSPPNLPPGFIDNPDNSTDDTKTEELAKAGSKRKSSAEFGTSDFWSSITKKKNI